MLRLLLSAFVIAALTACSPPGHQQIETDVLIIGAGASGTMASIQAARLGADVVVVEETPWVGGMLTSAGVAAIDGNHRMPSGLWGEFRSHLYAHYGGPDSVETGWVSNTLFEPHVGQRILADMMEEENQIVRLHGYRLTEIIKDSNRVTGAIFTGDEGKKLQVNATITIAADEYGDALAMSGANYRFGWEPRADYGDTFAPEVGNALIQDLTYVAILRDFGPDADMTIPEPEGYDPAAFDCTCKELCSDPDRDVVPCGPESGADLYMFNYGELPNNYFMINWPIHGNDYFVDLLEMSAEEREIALEEAKNFTLQWIYHLQTVGGYKNMGIAEDVFPTEDHFPLIPYIRESRRVVGVQTLRTQDLIDPYSEDAAGRFMAGIAVGDYPLDLHHERKPEGLRVDARTEDKPRIPSYNVPYYTMIPESVNGLIVAEKSISVTHVVNGATRLQPVVMLLGQAAGAAAAMSAAQGVEPRDLDLRALQQTLLDAGTWLMPFADTTPDEPDFQSIQRVGLSGVMQGTGEPVAWANRTWFYPDDPVDRVELAAIDARLAAMGHPHRLGMLDRSNRPVDQSLAQRAVWEWAGRPGAPEGNLSVEQVADLATAWILSQKLAEDWTPATVSQTVTRREMAVLLDRALNPFSLYTN
ncbi:MAG: FAD dependent oxidoreductase [Bacteroidetes bacterium HLUCCA01]|nr:MAG: FAD dependent oxidoreductase [Bacteroidetes bacterium HLUCCA01]